VTFETYSNTLKSAGRAHPVLQLKEPRKSLRDPYNQPGPRRSMSLSDICLLGTGSSSYVAVKLPVASDSFMLSAAQASIRSFAKDLMGRSKRNSPFLPPPTDAEIDRFEQRGQGGPTYKDFRVDVRGRNQRGLWNQACADIFAAEYLNSDLALTSNFDRIKQAFLVHIQALCDQYRKLNQPEDENPEETIYHLRQVRRRAVSLYSSRTYIATYI
jgi:hypothetical protein